jgi:hypothetical protein
VKAVGVIALVAGALAAGSVAGATPLLPLPAQDVPYASVCVTISSKTRYEPGVVVWHRNNGVVGYATWRASGDEIVFDHNVAPIPIYVRRQVRAAATTPGPWMRVGCRGATTPALAGRAGDLAAGDVTRPSGNRATA